MRVKKTNSSIPYLVIEDYFSEEELKLIMRELSFLTDSHKLLSPKDTGSATTEDNELKKENKGVFLDECYAKREISDILTLTAGFLADKKVKKAAEKKSWFYGALPKTNYDSTLMSYYEEKNYYEAHTDDAVITVLFWFNNKPKGFNGGDLVLPEADAKIPFKHNTVVIMPSFVQHEVEPITMKQENSIDDRGRYCVSKFLTIR